MAYDPTFIPLALSTSSGTLRLGCLEASVQSDVDSQVVRAAPKDWTMHRWKGGTLTVSGILQVGSVSSPMAAALPSFVNTIELASGQLLYKCRLVGVSTAPGAGRSADTLIGSSFTYSFMTYSAPAATLVFGTDGTLAGTPTAFGRWLASSGSRGYVNTSSGRFAGFHLRSCRIGYDYQNYEAPSLPTVIPVYTGGSMTLSGLADSPTLNMGAMTLEWLQLVLPGPSGNVVEAQIDHAVLIAQTAKVVTLSDAAVIMVDMAWKGSLKSSISSNVGDWYYS
jgi:hypothetical protein